MHLQELVRFAFGTQIHCSSRIKFPGVLPPLSFSPSPLFLRYGALRDGRDAFQSSGLHSVGRRDAYDGSPIGRRKRLARAWNQHVAWARVGGSRTSSARISIQSRANHPHVPCPLQQLHLSALFSARCHD